MDMCREWAMPNKNTFDIPPIKRFIHENIPQSGVVIDPFANSNRIATITNDIDPAFDADYNLDARDFLKMFDDESVDCVLYDPPYSPRQVSESYKKCERTVDMVTTSAKYWAEQKREIGRIVKPGGVVITCSWNSGGVGKQYGFEICKILLVAHGGWHNDTIVVKERKMSMQLRF